LEYLLINFFSKKIRRSLFFRLGNLIFLFTIAQITALYYEIEYSYTTQDTILDAHEMYFYSEMVTSWGSPPDTIKVKKQLENLQIWGGIYTKNISEKGQTVPDKIFWSNLPNSINVNEFYHWITSVDYMELYNFDIPLLIYHGEINYLPVTVVDDGQYLYYLIIDFEPPNELDNFVVSSLLTIFFMIGLYLFIRRYLEPVSLIKNRIIKLEKGDLDSQVLIIGDNELSDLSKSINKMIKDIRILLNQKQQLLLDVSHELRSPLARMKLLIEMMPSHKNIEKLNNEVTYLDGMISNLLLSDKLSIPYTNLDIKNTNVNNLISEVIDMFPKYKNQIKIKHSNVKIYSKIDDTKITIALRNLIDNSIKYGNNKPILISYKKDKYLEIIINDNGIGISEQNIDKIAKPFYRINAENSVIGFGLGLTICKKIIEAHKGQLIIQSEIGKGSSFIVKIPLN